MTRTSFKTHSRQKGYVLISVLVALALVTSLVAGVQLTARQAVSGLSLEKALDLRAFEMADLIAVAPSLVDLDGASRVDPALPWIAAVSVDGLVDLNRAPVELVISILRANRINTSQPLLILTEKRAEGTEFKTVEEGLRSLGLVQNQRQTVVRHFTVKGNASVNPDRAADNVRSNLRRALVDTGTEPLTDPIGPLFLVLTARNKDDDFIPRVYLRQQSSTDPTQFGVVSFDH